MQPTANMSVEQAFNIIGQVTAQYKGTLQEHKTILQALETIQKALSEPKIEIKSDAIDLTGGSK
jgi:hypothetical protein